MIEILGIKASTGNISGDTRMSWLSQNDPSLIKCAILGQ